MNAIMTDSTQRILTAKSLIESQVMTGIRLESGDVCTDRTMDSLIVCELAKHYEDIDSQSLLGTHIPASWGIQPATGFSSVAKWSHIVVAEGVAVGKVVVTSKRNSSAKIGPVYIRPEFRGRGFASRVVRELRSCLTSLWHMRSIYATVAAPI